MAYSDDFSAGAANNLLWDSISGSIIRTIFEGRSQSLFFSENGSRYAQTKPINTLIDHSIEFDLIYGSGLNGVGRNDYAVSLQYSTNNGASWTSLQTYSLPTDWTRFRVALPLAAQATSTLIRWVQDDGRGQAIGLPTGTHAWALDNISITPQTLAPPTRVDGRNRFDDGFWSNISNASITNTFAGRTQSFFFGGDGSRFATTAPINTLNFQSLSFDLIYGDGINGVSRNDYTVSLQYSTNNGTSWTTLRTYALPAQWTRFSVDMPVAAQTSSTLIRWVQDDGRGQAIGLPTGTHAWAIDNIQISEQPKVHPLFVDFSNDFNDSIWSNISNASITNTFSGRTKSLFFGGDGSRFASTVSINTLNFQSLSFDLIYGDGANGGSRNDYTVSLQYSTNNGTSWSSLRTYAMPAQWTRFSVDMPVAAQTSSTLIRWVQDDGRGQAVGLPTGSHVWALDNLRFNLSFTPGSSSSRGVNLGFTSEGDYALKKGTDFPIPITFGGKFASASKPGLGWTAVVATPSGSDYKLFWRNTSSFGCWILDSTGALSSSSTLGDADLFREESDANADINGDGRIGIEYTPGSTTINGVNLGSNPLGYAIKNGAAAPLQISFSGQLASASNPGAGWTPIAAAAATSGYDLYWKNSITSQFVRWNLNSTGALTTGTLLSSANLYAAESSLNADLDKDGITGLPFIAGTATIKGVNLGTTPLGYGIKVATSPAIPVTVSGQNASASNPGSGWNALAAAPSANGFQLYWKNVNTNQFARWNLGSSGTMTSASLLTQADIFSAETSLNFDLNNDKRIGIL